MGTMLHAAGLGHDRPPETWNAEQPAKVATVHRAYVDAGSEVFLTNTFGGTHFRLGLYDVAHRVSELNHAGARLAREVADAAPHPVIVAGSMGPTGKLLHPYGTISSAEAQSAYEAQARALVEGGVDVLWVETMSSLEELRAALEACRRVAPDVPRVATLTFDTHGRTMTGVTPEQALEAARAFAPAAVGGNCGRGPEELEEAIRRMRAIDADTPLIAKANVGLPRIEHGVAVYDTTPEDMAAHALRFRSAGARIIGACCGSTPEHIRAMAHALR